MTPEVDTFHGGPQTGRLVLTLVFLAMMLGYPALLWVAGCGVLAQALGGQGDPVRPLLGVALGLVALSLITAFWANQLVFSIRLEGDRLTFRNGNRHGVVPLATIETIVFLDSLKGWKYVIVHAPHGPYVLPNFLYSDDQFNAITDGMAAWLGRHGLADLVARDQVRPEEIGATGSKKLPFTLLSGLWKHLVVFTAVAVLATSISAVFQIDLWPLLVRHRS